MVEEASCTLVQIPRALIPAGRVAWQPRMVIPSKIDVGNAVHRLKHSPNNFPGKERKHGEVQRIKELGNRMNYSAASMHHDLKQI